MRGVEEEESAGLVAFVVLEGGLDLDDPTRWSLYASTWSRNDIAFWNALGLGFVSGPAALLCWFAVDTFESEFAVFDKT